MPSLSASAASSALSASPSCSSLAFRTWNPPVDRTNSNERSHRVGYVHRSRRHRQHHQLHSIQEIRRVTIISTCKVEWVSWRSAPRGPRLKPARSQSQDGMQYTSEL
eukprot:4328473-Pyramimonas_sp.AAC.1